MAQDSGGLVVYVTSHGFGHLNRTVAVLNRLPNDVPLTIKCHPDLFDHWRERLRRPGDLAAHVSDVGAVNPPGDSAATDGPVTLDAAARRYAEAVTKVDAEADWLRTHGASAVLCDIPFLPLVAADRAGVPGYALGNFTWAEIYAPHAEVVGGDAPALVDAIRHAYGHATALFRTEPALAMTEFRRVIDVGMVTTPGRNRRDELRNFLGLAPADRLVYFYIGRYGQANLGWDRLAALGRRGIHFVGFHPEPTGTLTNVHAIRPTEWTGADLAASADVMVAKAGYGTTCEALASGTPMIYPSRTGFAEFAALDNALRTWGGGVPVPADDFNALKIEHALDLAFSLHPGPPPFPIDGAERVAGYLVEVCRARP